jgi:hypothetical protein
MRTNATMDVVVMQRVGVRLPAEQKQTAQLSENGYGVTVKSQNVKSLNIQGIDHTKWTLAQFSKLQLYRIESLSFDSHDKILRSRSGSWASSSAGTHGIGSIEISSVDSSIVGLTVRCD